MVDYSKLYGKIREVYGTQDAFSDAMQMSRSALSLRLTGKVEWKTSEIIKACDLLGIPLKEAHLYFFALNDLKSSQGEEA